MCERLQTTKQCIWVREMSSDWWKQNTMATWDDKQGMKIQGHLHGDLCPIYTSVNNGIAGILILGEAYCHHYREAHSLRHLQICNKPFNCWQVDGWRDRAGDMSGSLAGDGPVLIYLADPQEAMDRLPIWGSPTAFRPSSIFSLCTETVN